VVEVYVRIVNEIIDAWRPVSATQVTDTEYILHGEELLESHPDEELEFKPGTRVLVETQVKSGDWGADARVLVAVKSLSER